MVTISQVVEVLGQLSLRSHEHENMWLFFVRYDNIGNDIIINWDPGPG